MTPLRISWLDFKVGLRMLARYPGLTLVGTVAMAIAIALGTLYFEGLDKLQHPRLPIDDAGRVITLRNWDSAELAVDERSLYDFAIWREQVTTVDDLGAAVVFVRNLVTEDQHVEPVRGAEITASGFALMGTPPLLGRTMTEQDEQPTAPPVVVIGYTLWKTRFGSDPEVLGRTVTLGTGTATIVGVMPEGFGFPRLERIWMPLRIDRAALAPRKGPAVSIFGRLAPGASMTDVQAELGTIAGRLAATYPEEYRNLRPRVTTYAKPLFESGEALIIKNVLYGVNGLFLMLLAIVCANVATLVFARSATRGWEIAVRHALGASRGRIVMQLFVEALVLAALAALVGLAIAKVALRVGLDVIGPDTLPFWITDSLSWTTLAYTGVLTLFGAAIVGILPALRVTRVGVQEALRSESGAQSTLRFGWFWTAVIVAQVAMTVALLPLAGGGVFESNRFHQRAEGIHADRYLTANVDIDREGHGDDPAFASRARLSVDALRERLLAEPGVEQVTFADRLPVMDQFKYLIELEPPGGGAQAPQARTTIVRMSEGFFETFGTSVIAGRGFGPVDFERGHVLVVNQSFAHYVVGDRNPVGRRVRILGGEIDSLAGDQWYEIVGVVKDFGWQLPRPEEQSAMYLPRLPTNGAENLAVRVRDAGAFADRLRAIALDVDPTIRLTDVQPLTDVGGGEAKMNWTLTWVAWLISGVVLLLSATGIHALMSFTVARRTREIGIRVALGARPGRIVSGIFSRALLQIGGGIVAGTALAAFWGFGSMREILMLLAANGVMLIVGVAACAVPLMRALRINPTEALRAEA
jgi:predicted permease